MSPKERISEAFAASAHISVRTAHEFRRWWKWTFAPFVDDWHGLSLNRFLAVMFGVAAVVPAFQKPPQPLTAIGLGYAFISGSLAWGKDVFLAYINRKNNDKAADNG